MNTIQSTYTLILITALAGACGDSGNAGTEVSGVSATETSSAGSTTEGPTTAEPTSTGTTDPGTTHDHGTGETTHDPGTTGTTHEHETTEHATDTSESTEPASTTAEPSSVADYCACMLLNCHDLYHGTWGEDHHEAEEMCAGTAGAFSAEVLSCRLTQCEAAAGDEALCTGTLEGPPCE